MTGRPGPDDPVPTSTSALISLYLEIIRMSTNPNPNIAKDLGNGLFLCIICSQQAKSKAWTAHVNGRKHRENLQRLKEKVVASSTKRQNEEKINEDNDVAIKRAKIDELREDKNYVVTTPWQAEAKLRSEPIETNTTRKNIIEGVPEGFFDDKSLNSRVKETIDKQKNLDLEYDRFMKELAEAEVKKDEAEELEEESTAIRNDIEIINEHIELWKSVEELEKKKEDLLSSLHNEPSKVCNMFRKCTQIYIRYGVRYPSPLVRNVCVNRIDSIRSKHDNSQENRNNWFNSNRVKLGIFAGAISIFPLYYFFKRYKSVLFEEKDNEPTSSTAHRNPSGIPAFVPYVCIGGGTASYYASLTIRARDPTARVLIIGDEQETPYNRPALSKELWWYGNDDAPKTLEYLAPSGRKRDVRYEVEGFYVAPDKIEQKEFGAVSFLRGRKVLRIDMKKKEVILDNNEKIGFEKCLIATGGKPKSMRVFDSVELKDAVTIFHKVFFVSPLYISLFWIDDYRKLDAIACQAKSIAMIGGGFLASELAYSLRKRYGKNGLSVHQIMPELGNFADILPEFLVEHIKNEMLSRGIQVIPNSAVKIARRLPDGRVELVLNDIYATKLTVDHVVVDAGIEPNVEVAMKSGLKMLLLYFIRYFSFPLYISLFWIDDYRKLDAIACQAKSIAVIGGGFLASELAYSLRKRYGKNGLSVHQIMPELGNFADILPEFLVEHIKNEMLSRGIQVIPNSAVKIARRLPDGRVELVLNDIYATKLTVDHVVVDAGFEPNVEVAMKSGLKLDKERGGILADAGMCVQSNIFAAGDVCSFDDITLGRRRLTQWEHAQISGRVAGENMTGGTKKYTHQSSFYTMLGSNVHFSGVGDVNAKYEMVSIFAEPLKDDPEALFRGIVFYLKEKRVVGVILYNVFGMGIEIARKIIADAREQGDVKQLAKLFDIYHTPGAEESKGEEEDANKEVESSAGRSEES
uniref:U1-type domain-containing protein n=1 Tax=Acrobeloides nanus TaxID=290746 RepID=A0A914C770_9BILA